MKKTLAFVVVMMACGMAIGGMIGSDNGRYVYGQVGEMREDQYLLDTQTGRMWQKYVDKDSGESFLKEIGRQNIIDPDTEKKIREKNPLVLDLPELGDKVNEVIIWKLLNKEQAEWMKGLEESEKSDGKEKHIKK